MGFDLGGLTTGAVYLTLFVLVFVESGLLVGFFLPGDTVLFAAGLLAGRDGQCAVGAGLIAVVLVAAVAGDVPRLRARPPLRPAVPGAPRQPGGEPAEPGEAPSGSTTASGPLAVVAARWIPWVRTLTPVLAGVAGMRYRAFLPANVVGAVTWGAGLILLGRLAADVPAVKNASGAVGAGFAVLFTVLFVVQAAPLRRAG